MNKKQIKKEHAIFDRAYDKAANIKPGGDNPLLPKEREILKKYLHCAYLAHRRRRKGNTWRIKT
jgi:hypothetical protein